MIQLAKPYLPEHVIAETLEKIREVLESGHLTQGNVVAELENSVKAYIGCNHAIAVSNCTIGLEIALRVFNVSTGDKVIVPAYTHPATHQVIRSVKATPCLVDVVKETALLDVKQSMLEFPCANAVLPVSLFGNPLDVGSIHKEFGSIIPIIEDAACSLGSAHSNIMTGNTPDISVFSFHPRKIITTGEGGLITTNNDELAIHIRDYLNFGGYKNLKGTNGKMSDINAAVGVVQMKYIDIMLKERRELASYYNKCFSDTKILPLKSNGYHNYQSYVVLIPFQLKHSDHYSVIHNLREYGIEAQVGTKVIGNFSRYPNTLYLMEHALTLPLYYGMTRIEQDYVIERLLEIV